jgi:poly-gamma-glutamate capsule biosynthesis protein CapA/YwtB (metallophosphatase superfamily)
MLLLAVACYLYAQRHEKVTASDENAFRMVWVGDTLLGANGRKVLAQHPPIWPFERVADLISGDYLIGNAEGPITTDRKPYFEWQTWNYNAPLYQADLLAQLGFDAMGLANNHLLDRGPNGVNDTREHLQRSGVATFGAGTIDEAREPLLVATPHGTVGVVAFSVDHHGHFLANDETLGLRPLQRAAYDDGIHLARSQGAKWLVAYVHWGENYSEVTREQKNQARDLVAAGFDLVVGHHPHVVQEVENIDGVYVFYSLGNFVFSTGGRFTPEHPGRGLVLHSLLGAQGFERFELHCLITDNREVNYQPRPCSGKTSREVFSKLGPDIEIHGKVGVILAHASMFSHSSTELGATKPGASANDSKEFELTAVR